MLIVIKYFTLGMEYFSLFTFIINLKNNIIILMRMNKISNLLLLGKSGKEIARQKHELFEILYNFIILNIINILQLVPN